MHAASTHSQPQLPSAHRPQVACGSTIRATRRHSSPVSTGVKVEQDVVVPKQEVTGAAAAAAAVPSSLQPPPRFSMRLARHNGSGSGSGSGSGVTLSGSKRRVRDGDEYEPAYSVDPHAPNVLRRSPQPVYAAAASIYVSPVPSGASSASPRGSLPLPFPLTPQAPLNIVQQLYQRQHQPLASAVALRRHTYAQRFGRLKLQQTLEARSPAEMEAAASLPPGQLKRSKISEVVGAANFVFALTQGGVCIAYDRTRSFAPVCCLNVIADEVIRSLFYNRVNRSLITVSVYRHDHFTSLRCRSTHLTAIHAGKPEQGVSLFTSESLQWPGFVEFDDVNKKILTFSASTALYKIWDLETYTLKYQLADRDIDEVKISPGIMLLIHHRDRARVPLKILNIETGEVLQSFTHLLRRQQKVVFIEQFNEKLLVKQKKTPLQMVDVADRLSLREIDESVFPTPAAFIFLYENSLFLTFTRRQIAVWNFAGERVTQFDDQDNWFADCNTSNVFINGEQDLILSYCLTPKQSAAMRQRNTDPEEWLKVRERSGSINVSHIFTGRCLAKIQKLRPKKVPIGVLSPEQQQAAMAARTAKRRGVRQAASASVLHAVWHLVQNDQLRDLQQLRALALSQQQNPEVTALLQQERTLVQILERTRRSLERARGADTNAGTANSGEAAAASRAAVPMPPSSSNSLTAVTRSLSMPSSSSTSAGAGTTAGIGAGAGGGVSAALAPSPHVSPLSSPMDIDDDSELDEHEDERGEGDGHAHGGDDGERSEPPTSDEEKEGEAAPAAANNTQLFDGFPLSHISFSMTREVLDAAEALQSAPCTTRVVTAASASASSAAGVITPRPPLCASMVWDPPLRTAADYHHWNSYVRDHNRALKDVTAVFYNEEHNEIYTGNKAGFVHVWSQ